MTSSGTPSQLLNEIMNSIKDGAAIFDADDRLVQFNDHYVQYFSLIRDLLKPGISFREIFQALARRGLLTRTASETEKWIAQRVKLFTDGAKGNEFQRVDGGWVSVDYYKLQSGGTFVVTANISERKRLELALHSSESRYRSIAGATPVGIFHTDANGEITFVNEKWCRLAGLSSEEAMGRGWLKALHPENFDKIRPNWYQAGNIGGLLENEYRFVNADGEAIWCYMLTVPESDDHGTVIGYIGALIDISQRKRAEEQLRQSQRMEAVGRLTGGIAHDFNNLLAIMLGNAGLLQQVIDKNDETKYYVQTIIDSIKRGVSLTERLLAFSRKSRLSPVAVDVTDLISNLEDMLRRTLGEMIDLRVEQFATLWIAKVDLHQFENALVNLALNARDAMPRGGYLTIKTANVTLDESYADRHEEVLPGDYIEVSVRDSGTGISPEILANVFEPFFTTKDVSKGSGLGLSTVFGFVKQSKGHITIHSEIGLGTMVKLFIPRSDEDVVDQCPDENIVETPGRTERILVVEDDDSLRKVSVTILRKKGYNVVEASDGNLAIELLKRDQPIDLLFTDIVLPGGWNGVEIAAEAMRMQPDIKILYTTGYTEMATGENRQLPPGAELLLKPYSLEILLEKLRSLLDGECR